ncbi:MAG: hypothetical protein AAGI90_05445 [Chlamydiota bacterium]
MLKITNNIGKQKAVLITGANNPEDVGAGIAKSFHNGGFKVILHDYVHPEDSAEAIPKELGSQLYAALNLQMILPS